MAPARMARLGSPTVSFVELRLYLMPATMLNCPECGATLRLANPPPAGKKVKCPKCSTIFLPSGSAPPPSTAVRKPATVKVPVKPSRPVAEEPDDREEDYAPARSRTKPARKPEPADDYEDQEDYDADEEEKPRPRKPVKGKNKRRAKGGHALLIGVVSFLILALLGFGAVAAWVWPGFLKNKTLIKGTGNEDTLAYVPADCQVFVGADVNAVKGLLGETLVNKLKTRLTQQLGSGVLEPFLSGDKTLFALDMRDINNPKYIIVCKTSQPYDPKELAESTKASEEKSVDGRLYYKKTLRKLPLGGSRIMGRQNQGAGAAGPGGRAGGAPGGRLPSVRPGLGGATPGGGGGAAPGLAGIGAMEPAYLGMPNDRVFFLTNLPEDKVKECLASDGATVRVPADIATMVRRYEKATLWFALPVLSEWKGFLNMMAGMNPKMTKEQEANAKAINEVKWMGGEVAAPGDLEITLSVAFSSDTIAKQQAVQGLREWEKQKSLVTKMAPLLGPLGAAVTDMANSLVVKRAGSIVLVSCKLSKQTVEGIKSGMALALP